MEFCIFQFLNSEFHKLYSKTQFPSQVYSTRKILIFLHDMDFEFKLDGEEINSFYFKRTNKQNKFKNFFFIFKRISYFFF